MVRSSRIQLACGVTIAGILALVVAPIGVHAHLSRHRIHPRGAPVLAQRPAVIALEATQPRATIPSPPRGVQDIQGYASATSVDRGESLLFAVSTFSPTYGVEVQRFGSFGDSYLTTVWQRRGLTGRQQGYWVPGTFGVRDCPTCVVNRLTGEVAPNWRWSFGLDIPPSWPSGLYRALLVTASGEDVVPFVVRADSEGRPVLVVISFNTYQAYNRWGGKSLYAYNSYGPRTVAGTPEAAMVSFARPYATWAPSDFPVIGYGTASDWMLAAWLAQHGVAADYAADADLARDPTLALDHRVLVFPGHQEYWSQAERTAVEAARDQGVNLAFLGGNDVYWRVRYQDAGRTLVEYRKPALDPERSDPAAVTGLFDSTALNEPQSTLLGTLYQSGVPGWLPWVVGAGAPAWLLAGTHLGAGASVPGVVAGECDVYRSYAPHPANLQIVGSAFFRGVGVAECDTTIYQAPSGAWVFDAGDMDWQLRLFGITESARVVSRMTANLLAKLTA